MQFRTPQAGAIDRPFGQRVLGRRAWPTGSRFTKSLDISFDWRRSVSLMRRLLSGDLAVIGEVSRTESDTRPTLAVLILSVLVASLGGWLWMAIDTRGAVAGSSALDVMLLGSIASLGAWALWLGVTWHALQSIFQIKVEWRSLMRAMALVAGFSVWQFFMLAGPAGFAVGLIVSIALVLLSVLAVRAAVPESDDRAAIISVGIGFSVYALVMSLLAGVVGVGSGIFVFAIG